MSIDNETKAAIEALVTAVGTTEASFRTGMSHIIDQVDANESEVLPEPGSKFYTASGNYTVPAGVTKVLVTGISGGGGGGGGNEANNGNSGGGGSGGKVYKVEVAVTSGDVHAVSIGAGGAVAGSGGATSLASFVVMNGGSPGQSVNNSNNGGSGGAAGNVSGNYSGGLTASGSAGKYGYGSGATYGDGAQGAALMPAGGTSNWGRGNEFRRGTGGSRQSTGNAGFMIIEVGE
jgi:hypothetical protein